MRKPTAPPRTDDLLKPENPTWSAFVTHQDDLREYVRNANDRYWSWDDLRAHRPPSGVTNEVAWLAVKLARLWVARRLDVCDTNGHHFWFGLHPSTLEHLHMIDKGLGGQLGAHSQDLGSPDRERYVIRSLMEEAIASSQIEGAVTTRRVAKEMLKTERKPRDESEHMILNNYRTIRWLREHKSDPLTFDLLYEIHRRITENTLDNPSAVGRFRQPAEAVSVVDVRNNEVMHVPPPAEELEGRMSKLCEFANSSESSGGFVHPVIRAIILHFWLAYDHPFVDGNGRTARALFCWCMLREGYWLFEFLSISRIILGAPEEYVQAFLNTELDEGDVTYFIVFHLRAIERATRELREYLEEQTKRNREMLSVLSKHLGLNHRQHALLAHGVRHANATYTIESHRGSHGVVFETARTDLAALARRGLLVEYKVGKRFHYAVPPDLRARLGLTPQ